MNALYNEFSTVENSINTEQAINKMRGLSPRILTTVLGVCCGMIPSVRLTTDGYWNYNNEDVVAAWNVNHHSTVMSELYKIAKYLPINKIGIDHIARQTYGIRGMISIRSYFDWIAGHRNEYFAQKVLTSAIYEESQAAIATQNIPYDPANPQTYEYVEVTEDRIWSEMGQLFYEITKNYAGNGEHEVDGEFAIMRKIDEEISKLMENPDLAGKINIAGVRKVYQDSISFYKAFVTFKVPTDDVSMLYILENIIPQVLPEEYELTDDEVSKIEDLIRELKNWTF